jgi:hypothetical protein
LYKPEYNVPEFQIFLERDTVSLGDEFVSTINVAKRSFNIHITEPLDRLISSSDSTERIKEYHFTPSNEGLHYFRGTIEYDTVKVPFEYKFIVVK